MALEDELRELTVARFDARKEVGYFLPLTLHADLLAALTERKAPVEVEGLVERLRGGKCPKCKGWGEISYCGEMINCGCHGRYEATISMKTRDEAATALQSQATELATLKQQLAEREEALREITGVPCNHKYSADEMHRIAARALTDKGPEQKGSGGGVG